MVLDLSNLSTNIISGLGPLLALFGEQVAKQFMSESTGFSDNILFAMAPIGIITASVGAIRIGGPNWMKAVIGRARENRAIAEIELMSSTSHEVCELWNGQQIVRIMGAPPIRELICITLNGGTEKLYTLKEARTEGDSAVLRKKTGDKFQRLNGRIGHSISSFLLLLVGHHEKAALANLEDGRKPISPLNSRNKRLAKPQIYH
ncbi:hypothetical protein P167DRAFT_609482 [Morchella conica CCBAS932]|uniref:Uncharacterized protein n=1 Tax=Morchella conica CCBAS932 TaxID=1392247 RepID=A0A3N4KA59_9PEZI|nr:hypothetical protein P167DRAFT_609482 [Morchella conica CCBAS932]